MTARRIIPCLDVKDGRVVKGVRFQGHTDMGDAADLAARAAEQILAARLAGQTSDPLLDAAIAQIGARLN